MNQDGTPAASALQLARRLLGHDGAQTTAGDAATVAAALQRTCGRVAESMRDSLGEAGWAALLVRALARTEADHPALKNIRRQNGDDIDLDCVFAGVEAHGAASAMAAFEALLAALIETLSRLIGEDMAMRLIDPDPPGPPADDEAQVL
jgi:hypothetical protein